MMGASRGWSAEVLFLFLLLFPICLLFPIFSSPFLIFPLLSSFALPHGSMCLSGFMACKMGVGCHFTIEKWPLHTVWMLLCPLVMDEEEEEEEEKEGGGGGRGKRYSSARARS